MIDCACRVLVQRARHDGEGELAPIENLAKTAAVPAADLVQILSELRAGRIITS